MHVSDPHLSRRGAFLLIALFSCLQILFGFFLITGNGQGSPVQHSQPPSFTASFDTPNQATFLAKLDHRQE